MAPTATADEVPIPKDIKSWFVGMSQMTGESFADTMFDLKKAEIHTPHTTFQITDAFLDSAKPQEKLLTPMERWEAAATIDGKCVGALSVDRYNGKLESGATNNESLCEGLLRLADNKRVHVWEPMDGDFFIDGTQVIHMTSETGIKGTTGTTKDLQGALREVRAEAAALFEEHGEVPIMGGDPLLLAHYIEKHGSTPVDLSEETDTASADSAPWENIPIRGFVAAGVAIVGAGLGVGIGLIRKRRS